MYKIDKPNLIKSDNDHFNLYPKAEGITNFLENIHQKEVIKHNNLIALYGEWGSGKSSVVTTVNEKLDKKKFNSFIFEAWKYEKDDNLPFSIFEAIMDNIIEDKVAIKKVLKEKFFKGLKSFANGITIKTPIIDMSLKDMQPCEIEESLYTKIENFIDKFKEVLDEHSKGKTTVIFIDDLDRCEDESIINLLIALKLMFALENVIFVCCIDRLATIEALKRKYNNNQEKAESFLDKLFLFDFNIIPIEGDKYLATNNIPEYNILTSIFKTLEVKNPRKIKKIINKIIILKELLNVFISTENLREKTLYDTTIYYLITLKEVDYLVFNNILNFNYYTYSLEKEYVANKYRYKMSLKLKFGFNSKKNDEIVGKHINKIISLFNEQLENLELNIITEEKNTIIEEKNVINGNIFREAIESLKKNV